MFGQPRGGATQEPSTITRVNVDVTFLRMSERPASFGPPLPPQATVTHLRAPSNEVYRDLQKQVGGPYLWWLRRVMPDAQLTTVLRNPQLAIHLLRLDGVPAGFYELDATPWPIVNLNYFGLMPHAVGQGLGYAFLQHALANAWSGPIRGMTVNTCNADHPRALPTYERAGFRRTKTIREVWNIPNHLGFTIPDHLKA